MKAAQVMEATQATLVLVQEGLAVVPAQGSPISQQPWEDTQHLSQHLLGAFLGMPHMCEICGKCFRARQQMKRHIKIHSGLNLHSCSQCGATFHRGDTLKKHVLTHTKDKPYKCKWGCEKTFVEMSAMLRHGLTHTKEKPFACDHCNSSFSLKWNLKIHMKRVH